MPEREVDFWIFERQLDTGLNYTRRRESSFKDARREIFKFDDNSGPRESWVQAAYRSWLPNEHVDTCKARLWEVHWRDNTNGCCLKASATFTKSEAEGGARAVQKEFPVFESWIQPIKLGYPGQWRVWWRNFRKADRNKGEQVGDHESMSRLIPQLDADWTDMFHWIEPEGLTDNLPQEEPHKLSADHIRHWFSIRNPYPSNSIPLAE